jgi:hypothetical protein
VISPLFWQQAPRAAVSAALPKLSWQRQDGRSAACDTAALMLYVALLFMREEEHLDDELLGVPVPVMAHTAQASYEVLGEATGLSRSLIRQGLERLEELGLIKPRGSNQKRSYELTWTDGGWFKLPCRAIVRSGVIVPFTHFKLRAKHELHAMKLYLYLASVIGRGQTYAQASYEKIYEKIGIPERDIRRAISILIGVGLLRNVGRENTGLSTSWGANKYYLTGDQDLYRSATAQAAAAVTEAALPVEQGTL